jgi:hypothetical protein
MPMFSVLGVASILTAIVGAMADVVAGPPSAAVAGVAGALCFLVCAHRSTRSGQGAWRVPGSN